MASDLMGVQECIQECIQECNGKRFDGCPGMHRNAMGMRMLQVHLVRQSARHGAGEATMRAP